MNRLGTNVYISINYLDTPSLDLVSIGLIDDENNSFYGINADCPFDYATDKNKDKLLRPMGIIFNHYDVIPQLDLDHPDNIDGWYGVDKVNSPWMTKAYLQGKIIKFLSNYENYRLVSYNPHFEWICLYNFFRDSTDLENLDKTECFSLNQIIKMFQVDLELEYTPHALENARSTQIMYQILRQENMNGILLYPA